MIIWSPMMIIKTTKIALIVLLTHSLLLSSNEKTIKSRWQRFWNPVKGS